MKNKAILLSLIAISTFSLSSCVSIEKKVDNKTGRQMYANAKESSSIYISNLSNKDFFSSNINGNSKGSISYQVDYPAESEGKADVNKYYDYNGSFKYVANHDIKKIRNNPLDLSGIESYLELNYDIDSSDLITKGKYINYQYDKAVTTYNQKLEENPIKTQYTLNDLEALTYSSTLIYVLDEFDINELMSYVFPEFDFDSYSRLEESFFKFENKEMNAQEFIDYIDKNVFAQQMFDNAPEGTYECVVKLLENYDNVNPANFFDYTKVEKKDNTILKSKFDYKEWGTSVNETLNKIVKELQAENESFEMITSIQNNIVSNLPDKFNVSYSVSINQNNIINDITFGFNCHGSLSNLNSSITNNSAELKDAKISYDIDVSLDLSFEFLDESVEVPEYKINLK